MDEGTERAGGREDGEESSYAFAKVEEKQGAGKGSFARAKVFLLRLLLNRSSTPPLIPTFDPKKMSYDETEKRQMK